MEEKLYLVSVLCEVNPKTGRYCRPFLIRTSRVKASSLEDAQYRVFIGNTEIIGRVSEMGTDNFIN